jgi:hypothetical protein
MRILFISGVLVAAVSSVTAGQSSRIEAILPPIFLDAVRAIEPPSQAGAWALQVITRGGFEGCPSELTIRSDGQVTAFTGNAAPTVHPDTLVSLGQRVRTLTTPQWTVDSRLGTCSDCVATLIVLSVREPNGLVSTHTAFWDATTKSTIPADLRRIYDLALTVQQ